VTEIKEQLVANNDETYWVPSSVKEKRFHNWLRDARDWAVSRNRYWGTPLPIWTNGDEIRVIGSVAELEEATGTKVTDLHRHFIDHLEIPSSKGGPPLKRVPEVFDCWFESGSMPYAQQHYPFERKEEFERDLFPAAFVAEGLDQTRGWFYTLMVLSTALFGKPAFQNLIVNGLVLASDGKKMSKRLRNYPDPTLVVHKYGADALRLYLINSPVVRAESLRFREEGVNGVVRDVFLPWFNAFRFFMQNVERFTASGGVFSPDAECTRGDGNEMDRWILAAEHNLIKFVEGEMSAYRLYTVIPRLVDFIEQLTNWYIRLNRRRMKGGDDAADTAMALMTTYEVLMNLCRLMAPFTPFFTEYMYQHLRTLHPASRDPAAHPTDVGAADSVHYLRMPAYDAERIDEAIEARVATMQQVVELGRVARERRGVSLRTPVRSITVVHKDGGVLEDALALKRYVLEEMNALEVHVTSDQSTWCKLTATPDFKLLGQRLGKEAKQVIPALKAMSPEDLATLQSTGSVSVGGVTVSSEEVKVVAEFAGDKSKYEGAASADGRMVVVVDIQMDEELELMGIARECVSRVQAARKAAGLRIGEPVHVYYSVAPAGERTPPPASPDVSGPVSKLGLGPYRKPLVDLDAPKEGGGGGGDGSGKQGGKKGGDAKKGGKQGGDAQKGGKKGGDAKKGGKKGGDAKKGGKQGGDAKKGGMKGPAVSADALMNRIHKALASQHSSVVETLGVPMVPDHPALRPPMATVVGVDEGEVAGVKFAVILTLPSPALGDDATVAAAAAATPPSTPAWRQAVYQTLGYCADAALASGMNATVDGVAVALKPGQHFWFRPDEALRACPALTAQLAADGLGDAMKPYQA
jgi:isoleucyl-tRNA synthetase